MVALGEHHGDLDGHWAIMEVIHDGSGTPLCAIRPCGMGITSKKALNMYGSLHLTSLYLLKGEQGDLKNKFQAWIGDIGC